MNDEQKFMAERLVLDRYDKLYKDLMQLTEALQKLEPTGVFVDDVTFKHKKDGHVQVGYKSRPVKVEIINGGRRFVLRVEESS